MEKIFQKKEIHLLRQNLQTILELSQVVASNTKTFANVLSSNGSLKPQEAKKFIDHYKGLLGEKEILILLAISMNEGMGFNRLRTILKGSMSSKTISEKLKRLEQERWLTRTMVNDRPFRVSYSLTSLGRKIANLSSVIGILILFPDEPENTPSTNKRLDKC
ncbi:MAG: winged helix-turn-helix transcriptional regulator [Candidatus Bathyarchaeota archaeon]|nr:winged helix-turn-helix transcriptional regulator [Candidatus Bathyarchaeota archaeon]